MIKPNVVAVDITYNCTLRCLHCYNSSGVSKSRAELSAQQLVDTFSQIAILRPESVCICGGEPLLRKNVIYDSISVIRKINKQISINMVSNGELIDEKEAEKLVTSGLNVIQISLDGAQAKTHDWLRGKQGAFNSAIHAIKLLNDARSKYNKTFEIYVAFTPTPRNYKEVIDAMKLCRSYGANLFRVQPLMLLGRARTSFSDQKELNTRVYNEIHHSMNMYSIENGVVSRVMRKFL